MWSPVENIVFYAGGALGLLSLLAIRGRPAEQVSDFPSWRTTGWALLGFLLLFAAVRDASSFFVGGDEYFRLTQAVAWASDPFFATESHVFLPGQFYVLGTLYFIFGHMDVIVALTSLVGVALTIHFAARLAFRMWYSHAASVFAGLLVGSHWVVLWSASNPMAEIFFWPCLLAALESWLVGWKARTSEAHGSSDEHFLRASLWVAAGTVFRYEMWYVGLVLGIFLGIRAVVFFMDRDPRDRQEALICLVSCAVIAAYPVAWLVSSQMQMGSPIAFLEAAAEQHRLTSPPADDATRFTQFFTYPTMLMGDNGTRLWLVAFGVIGGAVVSRRGAMPQVVAVICISLMAMLVSVRVGLGSANPERLTVFLELPMLCLAAGPLALMWDVGQPALNKFFRLLVVAFLLLATVTSAAKSRAEYPNADKVHPEFLALMTRLEREGDLSRESEGYARIHPQGTVLDIFHGGHSINLWMTLFHSGSPDRVVALSEPSHVEQQFAEAAPGTHILVRKPRPDLTIPTHVTLLEDMVLYELWEVGQRNELP